jgi:hypothetical protein
VIIPVQQLATLNEVERCLGSVVAATTRCDLRLANQMRSFQFGVAAATLQLLTTWAHRHPDGTLITYSNRGAEPKDHYSRLASESAPGLIGLLTAPKIASINRDLTTELARASALQFLEQCQGSLNSARLGPEIQLVCYDDQPDLYPRPLYDSPARPKGIADFESLFSSIETSIVRGADAKRISRESVANIGIILKELFWNTHEWARRDMDDVAIPRSVRAIRCIFYRGELESLRTTVGRSEVLREYLLHPRPQSAVAFLEVSVLDSGIGLAQRRILKPLASMTLADEYAAIIDCLLWHSSSSSESHRGIGLHVVLRTLTDLGGFLRVRTGRLALQRDFVRYPYRLKRESTNREVFLKPAAGEPYLLDWVSGENNTHTCLAPVSGTLLTMLLPVS